MKHYQYIIIILVYRNYNDLMDCMESIRQHISDSHTIIVNAYFDDDSRNAIQNIARSYDCDFLNIENKGYSYGNNRGIEYAISHYDFNYIIISNPDIIIRRFEFISQEYDIIAPKIITLNGKNQNPMIVKENRMAQYFIYQGLKNRNKLLFIMGLAINKIIRLLYTSTHRGKQNFEIYAAHGSFLMISKKVINAIRPLYDENMFLFAEESVLAYKANNFGFTTIYYPQIEIFHKEDGSMKISDISVNEELRKSNIYYYENYISRKIL